MANHRNIITMKKEIDYYGDTDSYIHLKFGDVQKKYNFTPELIEKYPAFTTDYQKYFNSSAISQFKNPFQIVRYVHDNGIPVHFYYNFTDTPAKDMREIMEYLVHEQSYIHNLN